MAKEKVVDDQELQAVFQRAKKLRVSKRELAEQCGETSVNLWRWEHQNAPQWDRRDRFLKRATEFLDACQREYSKL